MYKVIAPKLGWCVASIPELGAGVFVPGAGDPQSPQFVVAAPRRGRSRLEYARAVLPAPQLSPQTTTSARKL